MKTLIIPDVHQRLETLRKILRKEEPKVHKVIFLGDYFDDFHDSPEDAAKMAIWLKKALKNPKFKFLFGNHDVHYYRPRQPFVCSGFTRAKSHVINKILDAEDWFQFSLHDLVTAPELNASYLLTHAGLHYDYLREDKVNSLLNKALTLLRDNRDHYLLEAGFGRGGHRPFGGVTWLDWDKEFLSTAGWPQIVGHTPHTQPQFRGDNVDLDTHLEHYAIHTAGEGLEIRETGDL